VVKEEYKREWKGRIEGRVIEGIWSESGLWEEENLWRREGRRKGGKNSSKRRDRVGDVKKV
jgi:hypothetical protein